MKKVLLIAIVALGLGSCKKDKVTPEPAKNCKCYTVTKKETVTVVEGFPLPQPRSWQVLTLQNICDRVEITRQYTTNQALNIGIGDRVCD
jgi:hypothetical protein